MGFTSQMPSPNQASTLPEANATARVSRRHHSSPHRPAINAQLPTERSVRPKVFKNTTPGYPPSASSYASVTQGLNPRYQQPGYQVFGQHRLEGMAICQIGGLPPRMKHLQQQQAPVGYMMPQQFPMNGHFQQEVMQPYPSHQMPPMDCTPPGVMYGEQPQFFQEQMYNAGPNLLALKKTTPPPGFESYVPCNGQPLIAQCGAGFGTNPSFVNCSFNQHIELDGSIYPPIPMQPFPLFIPSERMPNKRRPKAIAVIDPATGADKLNEIYGNPKPASQVEEECASSKQ